MRVPRLGGSGGLGMNMTPMIDVVFLLIIFFLVSSHLARRENEMPLDLPTASSSEDPDTENARVTLNVSSDGQLILAGATVSSNELAARLKGAAEREGKNLEIRIRRIVTCLTDTSVRSSRLQPIGVFGTFSLL